MSVVALAAKVLLHLKRFLGLSPEGVEFDAAEPWRLQLMIQRVER